MKKGGKLTTLVFLNDSHTLVHRSNQWSDVEHLHHHDHHHDHHQICHLLYGVDELKLEHQQFPLLPFLAYLLELHSCFKVNISWWQVSDTVIVGHGKQSMEKTCFKTLVPELNKFKTLDGKIHGLETFYTTRKGERNDQQRKPTRGLIHGCCRFNLMVAWRELIRSLEWEDWVLSWL